jgi:ribosomal protein L37E
MNEEVATEVQQMDIEVDYSEQWHELRRRRRIFWLIALGGIPCVIILTTLVAIFVGATGLPPYWIDRAFFVAGFAWMFGSVGASRYEIAFLCPRCGKRFFATWWYYNGFARRCVHCGLPKWSNLKNR